MKGIVKIGKTKREVNNRLSELYKTGVPLQFKCVYSANVENEDKAEKAAQKNESTKVILFILGISSLVGIVSYINLRPPCLAKVKERLNNPDSMKVVSWDRGTYTLEVSAKNGLGVRNRIKFSVWMT